MKDHRRVSYIKSTPAVQLYDISYIHSHIFTNSQYDQLPVGLIGLIAQLVEHCTGITEDMCSRNPFKSLNLFQA